MIRKAFLKERTKTWNTFWTDNYTKELPVFSTQCSLLEFKGRGDHWLGGISKNSNIQPNSGLCFEGGIGFGLGKGWRRKWQPTPVFLPGKSHGQRTLVGWSPWGCKGSGMTEQLTLSFRGRGGELPRLCRIKDEDMEMGKREGIQMTGNEPLQLNYWCGKLFSFRLFLHAH